MRFLVALLILASLTSRAQHLYTGHIGLIDDPDGFTFVRSGQTKDSSIIDSLFTREFFVFRTNDSSHWFEVYKFWNVEGFVHKSRIRSYDDFSREELRTLFDSLFSEYIELAQRRTSEGTEKWMAFHEDTFDPSLQWFIQYQETEFDKSLLLRFFDILILASESADETPATALGHIYMVQPTNTLALVEEYQEGRIIGDLEFGFLNVAYGRKDQIENFEELDSAIKALVEEWDKR